MKEWSENIHAFLVIAAIGCGGVNGPGKSGDGDGDDTADAAPANRAPEVALEISPQVVIGATAIDDFRIYDRPLTSVEVAAISDNR